MKVLFVGSGNNSVDGYIDPIMENQRQSLLKEGLQVDYFLIKGHGVKGYISNIPALRDMLHKGYDVIHAHYSMSAFLASLAGAKPLIVSLMGSDVKSSKFHKVFLRFFSILFSWKSIIVKSQDMYESLGFKKASIIPNGVNIDKYTILDTQTCRDRLGWDSDKKHILFAADPDRFEKNYALAKQVIEEIESYSIDIHFLKNIKNSDTPIWFNASDIVMLTSLWEGSPNVIKEAMACGAVIISTDVGDVKYLFGKTEGCFITLNDVNDCYNKLMQAFDYLNNQNLKFKRRDRISELNIDSVSIANKLIKIYQNE